MGGGIAIQLPLVVPIYPREAIPKDAEAFYTSMEILKEI